ncbi:MAG: NAD(P)-dependent oxidoreductase [Bacilli bacterium]
MKIFMIGGTGLLGSESAKQLIALGHEVVSLSLNDTAVKSTLPKEMKLVKGNYLEMSDEELTKLMEGSEGFIFAAGIDERVESKPPIYDLFKKYNIDALERLLKLAKASGIKHSVVYGSYFSHFAKKWPELELTKYHQYIRSRIDQEKVALSFADENFDVAVLELPYIFGVQKGRKPVWVFLVEMLQGMKKSTYYTKGGTTMVTVKQVGQATVGALLKNKGGNSYPIGYYNMEWAELFKIFHKHMGLPEDRKVVTIPTFLFLLSALKIKKEKKKAGLDAGLDLVKFAKVQTSNLFINKDEGATFLGVKEDDIDHAIGESVKLSIDIINKKEKDIVEMKAE